MGRLASMGSWKWITGIFIITMILTGCGDTKNAARTASSALISGEKQKDIPDIDASESVIETETETETEIEIETISDSEAEKLYDYEIKTSADGSQYAVINGFCADYAEYLSMKWNIVFPEQLGGAVVTEFAPYAFQNVPLGNYGQHLRLSPNIVSIGEHCFENCGLKDVIFEKSTLPEKDSSDLLTVHACAFADNPELWGVYFSNRTFVLESNVFECCADTGYLCYMTDQDTDAKMADYLKTYSAENQWNTVEIPAYFSSVPIVDYPETPLILKPRIGSFFYGENADDDRFCSFEYDDLAPDYGFPEWHIPCGEFCAMAIGTYEIEASSCLSPESGNYAVENVKSGADRSLTWAEGVDGYGIGESIRITSGFGYLYDHARYPEGEVAFLDGDIEPDIYDGYMRYTEICIVNGYAKNETVWKENGRVKRLLMYVEDRPYAYLELEDTMNPQYFTLPADAIKAADGVEIHFQFVIEEVYEGTKYEDTCLTGLVMDFMGRRGH